MDVSIGRVFMVFCCMAYEDRWDSLLYIRSVVFSDSRTGPDETCFFAVGVVLLEECCAKYTPLS